MTNDITDIQNAALSPSTRQVYASGVKCFKTFCSIYGYLHDLVSLPVPTEKLFIAFIVYCAKRKFIAFSSIKLYLAGVRHAYIIRGLGDPLKDKSGHEWDLFKLTLKGVRNVARGKSLHRLPITASILKDMCKVLSKGVFSPYLDLLMYSACLMAFFGFMRCGEFTCASTVFNPARHLALSDVRFHSIKEANSLFHVCIIHLKFSKIDQEGQGTDIKLFANPSYMDLCPVTWMHKFLSARKCLGVDPSGPLFMLPDMSPLTRPIFLSYMQQILHIAGYENTESYTGHSFRAGSATSASAINMPDYMLCLLGRWHSDAYKRYIKAPLASLQRAQIDISQSPL